jgi:ubiquinone/menaquinone biosynthesis C-methylase UbiE
MSQSEPFRERVCPPRHARWLNLPLRRWFQRPEKMLGAYVQPGYTVVDLGCGGGFFTVIMAKMVGEKGRVIAVDLQEEMLEIARSYARKKGVLDRIDFRRCSADDLRLNDLHADFALAVYVVHEVPEPLKFFTQTADLLKPDGVFLMLESKAHVDAARFRKFLTDAGSAGLAPAMPLKRFLSRGMVFYVAKKV